jgi:hypothetical protein
VRPGGASSFVGTVMVITEGPAPELAGIDSAGEEGEGSTARGCNTAKENQPPVVIKIVASRIIRFARPMSRLGTRGSDLRSTPFHLLSDLGGLPLCLSGWVTCACLGHAYEAQMRVPCVILKRYGTTSPQ